MRLLLIAVIAAGVAGCSMDFFESKKIDYKSVGKVRPLEIPPDLTTPARDDRYAVPDISPKGSATYSAYSAERSGQTRTSTAQEILPDSDSFRIERAGSQRWLVANAPPEKLWQVVKDFWLEMGFLIHLELPDAGIMETDWAENRAKIPQDIIRNTVGRVLDALYSTPERDKFRTRLEPGRKSGTTEVFISHRGMYEIYTSEGSDRTVWQPRPADAELEAEMLFRLMVKLGADEKRARQIVAEASPSQQAQLKTGAGGGTLLEISEGFDRAWRRVGLALDRVGFTVEDRNRADGVYFVRYVDPLVDAEVKKKDEGFLSKLAFWRKSSSDTKQGTRYRVLVAGSGEISTVRVASAEGQPESAETAKKILGLLHDQLK